MRSRALIILILLTVLSRSLGATALPDGESASKNAGNPSAPAAPYQPYEYSAIEHCPALPPPTGNVVNVSTEAELWNAVNAAQEGDTILLADGDYNLGQNGHYVWIDTPQVTLRSASGNREAVVLDDEYAGTEIISVVASGVTVADLTIKRAGTHPIHVMSSDNGDTLNTLIYNVHITDPREQAIKINPASDAFFPDYGEVACSHIELTDEGRPHVNPIAGGCYTGGVDAHQARGWRIRDNIIEGFWCPNGLSEHGVHMWRGCRDSVVERNLFIDNARGVGFGLATSGDARTYADNPCPEAGGGYVDHYEGIIRNNWIFASRSELFSSEAGFDCGICLWQACHAKAVHNSVVSTQAPFSSVEWRFDNTYADITNNVVSHNLMDRGGHATLAGNLDDASLSLFVDGASGDLHLTSTASDAIDRGASVDAGVCDDDIDGDARPIGPARDIGADEYDAPSNGPHAFEDSFKQVSQVALQGGETITYTVVLYEATDATLTLTDTIPAPLTYVPDSASVEPGGRGTLLIDDSIRWSGTVTSTQSVTVTFQTQVPLTTTAWVIINRAQLSRDGAATIERLAVSVLNGFHLYLPVALKNQ
jgi:uncharacterized repeat protein (TIGR01451 family)